MFRNPSLVLAVSVALWPASSSALSLGGMATRSALNEPFQADIELIAAGPDDLETLQVALASAVDFARMGLDRPFLLSKLRFKPMRLKNGRSVIHITSREPVREPFLDFLVEINWPKGRLVRKFTALLDPPPPPQPTPLVVVTSAPAERAKGMASSSVAATRPPQQKATEPPAMTITGQYGPVRRGATLWSISNGLRVAGARTEQVMMALFRSNPEAFAGGNINMLKAGAVLRVPSPDDMLSQPGGAARAEFLDEARGVHRVTPIPADRLRIALKPKEKPSHADASKGSPRGAEVEQVRTDLMMVREASETNRQETEDLRSRIRELETQLNDIRQLFKLKSDQLAQIQAGQTQGPGDATVSPPRGVGSAPSHPAEILGAGVVSPPTVPVQPKPPTPSNSPVTTEPVPQPERLGSPTLAKPEAPTQTPEPSPIADQGAEHAPHSLPVKAASPRDLAPPGPLTPSLLDQVLGDTTTLLALAGAVLMALLALGGLLLRRRRTAKGPSEDENERLVSGGGMALGPEPDPSAQILAKVDTTEDTSFISDFSSSDINTLQEDTGEVDPLAEADVYIAYGRYQQAENLIKQALDKSPERPNLKLKLLDIYFTTRNLAAFTRLAEEIDAAGLPGQEPQLWEHACSMGRELLPAHPLFKMPERPVTAQRGMERTGIGQKPSPPVDELANLDLDLDTDLSEVTNAPRYTPVLDFPPRSKTTAPAPDKPPPSPLGMPDQESEFTLNLDDLISLEDIDLGDIELEPEVSIKPKSTDKKDVPSLSSKRPAPSPPPFVLPEEEDVQAISLDDMDLGMESFQPSTGSGKNFASEPPKAIDLGEEVETKLDLARAYLEMGDGEGAREILQEVLTEGNPSQQATARKLLTQVH